MSTLAPKLEVGQVYWLLPAVSDKGMFSRQHNIHLVVRRLDLLGNLVWLASRYQPDIPNPPERVDTMIRHIENGRVVLLDDRLKFADDFDETLVS